MLSLDPLLIQSFPAPPTYIPSTPTSPNPPPCRPPSVPLPPVPGPSRILGQESFFLLSSVSTRCRRASKVSLASIDSARTRPPSSFSPPHSPLHLPKKDRNDNRGVLLNLDLNSAVSDADSDTDFPAPPSSPSRTRLHRNHRANESISSIDMRDILAATAGSSDTEEPNLNLPPSLSFRPRTRSFPAPPPAHPPPSPDIATIISSTPKPCRSRVSSLSSAASSKHDLKRRVSDGIRQKSKPKLCTSEPPLPTPRLSLDPVDRRSWIDHDEFGRPIPLPLSVSPLPIGDRTSVGTDEAMNGHEDSWTLKSPWETHPNGGDDDHGNGSDSSLDIHTPLPHLMLKHGLLSPRSKLLAGKDLPTAGRESMLSLASTKTNGTGLLKDSRDTEHRRTRHRDGRLLRGGIGLTTGLGWSDSEDEDAPSALTRRLSTLALSRRSSSASFAPSSSCRSSLSHSLSTRSLSSSHGPFSQLSHASSFSHYPPSSFNHHSSPLTRSCSSGTLVEYAHDRDGESEFYDELNEWGVIDSSRWSNGSQTLPSNLRKSTSSSSSSRTSSSTTSRTRPRKSSITAAARISGSVSSIGIPEDHEGEEKEGLLPSTRLTRMRTSSSNRSSSTSASSPSTASTRSIQFPLTPQDNDISISTTLCGSTTGIGPAPLSREKSLPPLPPSLRRVSGKSSNLNGVSRLGRGIAFPRPPSEEQDVSTRSTGNLGRKTPTSIGRPSGVVSPRPLRLASAPQLAHSTSSPQLAQAQVQARDRPAVPVPSVAATSSSSHQLRAPVAMRSTITPVEVKPRPRTGTGMVYRSAGGPSKLRLPSSTLGPSSSSGRASVAGGRVPVPI